MVKKATTKKDTKVKATKALTKVNKTYTPSQINPEVLIQQAITQGVPVETMERLLAMRKELKAEWSKERYDESMMNFQMDCPVIKKTKGVKDNSGTVVYSYAPIESIVTQVKGFLQKHGFSYSIQTESKEKAVYVTCIVKHIDGHSEEYNVEMPYGTKTKMMSDTQVTASAMTFGKRYAFCNAFGILTGDEDNDGADINSKDSSTPTVTHETPQKPAKEKDVVKIAIKRISNITSKTSLLEAISSMQDSRFTVASKNQIIKAAEARIKEL